MHLCLDTTFPLADGTEGAVRVVVADVQELIDDEAAQTKALSGLSPMRREKALACKNPRSRALSTGVSLLLDLLLQPLGLRERDMVYVVGEHGKPEFRDCPSPFNLSHSGSLAAAAIVLPDAAKEERRKEDGRWQTFIGLDIQRITRYRPELVRRVFGVEERAALAACTTEGDRERLFTELWCRAEAYAKATGRGLQWPTLTPPPETRLITLSLPTDYCGCLCTIDNHL